MNLTTEQMRMLAQVERDMDDGKQPYVVAERGRWAFPQKLLDECGIVSGQTVSHDMIFRLMQMNIAIMETNIAIEKMKKA